MRQSFLSNYYYLKTTKQKFSNFDLDFNQLSIICHITNRFIRIRKVLEVCKFKVPLIFFFKFFE